jgi:hypothetical protein
MEDFTSYEYGIESTESELGKKKGRQFSIKSGTISGPVAQKGVSPKRCQSKRVSVQKGVSPKRFQSKRVPVQKGVSPKGCQSKKVSVQKGVSPILSNLI